MAKECLNHYVDLEGQWRYGQPQYLKSSKTVDFGNSTIRIHETSKSGTVVLSATGAELNILDGVTATTAELNILDGVTATTAELNYVDGVTSAIQTQLNDKASITGSETLTNKTLTDPAITGTILEDIYTISDGAAFEIDPGNGSIQLITLGASRTPKATNFAAGESVTLLVDDGTAYTINWATSMSVTWVNNAGSAPTLATTGYTVIALWKVSTTLYGALVGDGS